jgi:hypothetical protein
MSGCAAGNFSCEANYTDGKSSKSFADVFLSHNHNENFLRRTLNTSAISEYLLVKQWERHLVETRRYDTGSVDLPLNWTRLYDGRILSDTRVFYPNGTYF